MLYTIASLNDQRRDYKYEIRKNLSNGEFYECGMWTCDGRDAEQLKMGMDILSNPPVRYDAKVGQLGRWITFIDHAWYATLNNQPMLCFEDDALLSYDFHERFPKVEAEVPSDADFFSLFIPRNKPADIYDHEAIGPLSLRTGIKSCYDVGSEAVVRAYQPYGGVAMVLYPNLSQKIHKIVGRDGITAQFDDVIYAASQRGELNGYTVVPDMQDLVWITGEEKSTVQDTESYKC